MPSLSLRNPVVVGLIAGLALIATPEPSRGQSPPDSASLRKDAEELQAAYESFRERSMPAPIRVWDGSCDLRVGRMCMRHDRGDDPGAPPEPPPVGLARTDLLGKLGEISSKIPGDGWLLGQRVLYQLESGGVAEAEAMTRSCGLPADDGWWCAALLGLVLHRRGNTAEAAVVFQGALRGMPVREAERWTAARFLLDGEGRDVLERASPADRALLERRVWLLSDPLYMVPENDRQVEQYARFVVRRIRETGANPYSIPWDEDLEELLIRYGQEIGWERARGTDMPQGLQDGRVVIGRQIPGGVEYLPSGSWLNDPSEVPNGAWAPESWTPRTAYRAPYAGTIIPLETQVARFRRGLDSLLVVTGHAPAPEEERRRPTMTVNRGPQGWIRGQGGREERPDPFGSTDPFGATDFGAPEPEAREVEDPRGSTTAPLHLYLVPVGAPGEEDGAPQLLAEGGGTSGVTTARVPNGRYLMSLEAWDREGSRAWRAREGVNQRTIPPDLPSVSDLLLLTATAPDQELPANLEEALPRVRAGSRLRPGETVAVAWEIYALRPEETVALTLGLDRGAPGLLQRAGEFLRIVQPDAPVTLTFQETAPDGGVFGRAFRGVNLTLPETLEPGDYVLSLEVQLQGRSAITTERVLRVEPGAAVEGSGQVR
jgi:hypothetical protein